MSRELNIRVNFCGRVRAIRSAETLWTQHEIAQTRWPIIGGNQCAQMRVRGKAGDREGRNNLVVDLGSGLVVKPHPRYFVRPDPYDPAARPKKAGTKGDK